MNFRFFFIVGIGFLVGCAQSPKKVELKTEKDRTSYAIGLDIGKSFKQLEKLGVEVDPEIVAAGIRAVSSTEPPLLTDKEIRQIMLDMRKKQAAKLHPSPSSPESEKNRRDGEAFLAANKTKEGIQTTPSGLQYKILKETKGKKPKNTDFVTVHYRGTLVDGSEFDSSYRRGQPATFPVSGVIHGWTEALLMMTEGSKWQLFIPSNLAYGERGAPPRIAPHSVLIFEVELISIKEPPPAAKEPPAASKK